MQAALNAYDADQRISEVPRIFVYEDFVTDEVCAQLIEAARSQMKQALVSDDNSGVLSTGRTGSNCWIKHNQTPAIARMCQQVSEVVGVPLAHAESIQVIHYATTEEYAPHFDAWDPQTERGARCMARGGQRMTTCLMYLNTVKKGGGTAFPALDLEVTARQGRMLMFDNCQYGTTKRDADCLHGGMPVIKGEKWACNLWFRERPLNSKSTARPFKSKARRGKGRRRARRVI